MDDDIGRSIRRLSRLLRRILLRSSEFEQLCILLEKGQLEMRLFLVPVLFHPAERRTSSKKRKKRPLRFELTERDKKFLKKVGIRF